jgi:hypothetical protein
MQLLVRVAASLPLYATPFNHHRHHHHGGRCAVVAVNYILL